MSHPNRITPPGAAMACVQGDHRLLRRVGSAQATILAVLQDADMPLSDYHWRGLLLALEELNNHLEERAIYLEEIGLVPGGQS